MNTMKKINLFVTAFVLISVTAFAQSQLKLVKERVGDDRIVQNWKVGEVKEVNDVKVLRVEGENGIDYRTNVFYISQGFLLADINKKAALEPIYSKELGAMKDYFTNEYPGGQVAIFYDRLSQELADPRNF